MFASVAGTWLPLALIFLVTWIVGLAMSMIPVRAEPVSDGGRGRSGTP
jgi:hypothetical protein